MSRHGENREGTNRRNTAASVTERGGSKEEKNRTKRYKNRRDVNGGSRHAALGASLLAASMWPSLLAYSRR